ncbi:hypothetical protein Q670_02500 [Alcanivorax sp. P2S70]|uniref:hypothetical protein n=1 Tax=Alcanivorax sp. P2S70 TaxID=1397527 RepID=UPI0003B79268|nr:hypothetical protein [Alcanivorax sp. P2S70]ERP89266.1 hypothetical protein Q670_02500 [Alcanivorax sp. P2S70]
MNRPGTTKFQRGAISVVTPLLLLLIVILSVLALDGARLYALRSDMQALVNVAAQAGASATQSCGGLTPSVATVRQRALTAARAQGFTGEDADLLVQVGVIEDADDDGVLAFDAVNFIEESNAVLVSLTRSEPISLLLPQSTFGSLELTVNAAARKEVVATISAAGGLASVGGDGTLLGGLLGAVLGQPGFALDPTSLSSLENATVRLGDLLTDLGVNQVVDLLPLDADQLASALGDVAGLAGPVADLLDDIAAAPGIETIQIGDVIDVVENASVPDDSEFPIYDLVISLVLNIAEQQQAGSDGVIALPVNISSLSIPLVANIEAVDLSLHVGEPPTVKIGPARQDKDGNWRTRFYAPDITLQLTAEAELLPISLGPLLEFSLAELDVPLAVNAGGGGGALVAADCASGSGNSVEFTVEVEREVARIVTGSLDSDGSLIAAPLDANVGRLRLLGLPALNGILHLNAEVDGTVPGVTETVTMDPRYNLYCDPVDGCDEIGYSDEGDGVSGLDLDIVINEASLLETSLGSLNLNLLLNPIVDLVEGLLETVVESLGEALINPLLRTLGVGLGSISVNVSAASQDSVQLIENIAVVGAEE